MLYTRMNQAVGTLYQDGTFLEKAKRQRQKIRERSLKGVFYTDHEERREDSWYNPGISTEVCQYYAFFCGVANEKEDAGLWKVLKEDFGHGRIEKENIWKLRKPMLLLESTCGFSCCLNRAAMRKCWIIFGNIFIPWQKELELCGNMISPREAAATDLLLM